MLTADTITDEQCKAARDAAWETYRLACAALGYAPSPLSAICVFPGEREQGRAICAEILNARAKEDKQP